MFVLSSNCNLNLMQTAAALLLAFLLSTAVPSIAQEVSSPSTTHAGAGRTRDISLFTQSGGPLLQDGSVNIHGGIYRREKGTSGRTFWKAGLGVGSAFNATRRQTQPAGADTALDILYNSRQRVVQALGGIETERQLRRGIYLTAGFEVQAGGSDGGVDSLTETTYYNGGGFSAVYATPQGRFADTRQYFGTGLGVLGIRAYTRRFTAALEVFNGVRVGVVSQTLTRLDLPERARNYSIFDLGVGGFGSRFSVGYRF